MRSTPIVQIQMQPMSRKWQFMVLYSCLFLHEQGHSRYQFYSIRYVQRNVYWYTDLLNMFLLGHKYGPLIFPEVIHSSTTAG